MTGEIPPELGNLESMEVLDLGGNNLTGEIPPELGNLKSMKVLDLGGNNLTGEIPPELGNLKSMKVLDLGGNNLTGEIPPELGNFYPVLRGLDLSGNNLTGEIPPELARLRGPGGLNVLRLNGNRFTGCIPAALRSVKTNDLAELGLPFCGQISRAPTAAPAGIGVGDRHRKATMTERDEDNRPPGAAGEDWPILRAQPRSFFKAPLCVDLEDLNADVAFIGMPFDQGTAGAARRPLRSPDAIRDAPRAYSYTDPFGRQQEAEGFFNIEAGDELLRGVTMADCGDITTIPSNVHRNFDKLTQAVAKVVERGSFPVVVGGDHAITYPVVRGPGPLRSPEHRPLRRPPGLLPRLPGRAVHSRHPVRRCRELPFVNHITSVGIRTARRQPYEDSQRDGSLIITTSRFPHPGTPGRGGADTPGREPVPHAGH